MSKINVICNHCEHKFQSRLVQGDQTSFNTMIVVNSGEPCPKCGKPVTVNKNVTFE